MTPREAWCNHAANVLVGASGVVYGWMLYLVESTDDFAIANHPWQPFVHSLHVATAPLLVFAIGLLWSRHAWGRVRGGFKVRRKTGLVLVTLAAPMIVSGYAIQVATSESIRQAGIYLHVATSAVWLLAYAVHQVSSRTRDAKATARSAE